MRCARTRLASAALGVAALLLSGCGGSADEPDAASTPSEADAACRAEFAALQQKARENGNPAAEGTPLAVLWEREDDVVAELVRTASAGDCRDDFGGAKRRYESLVDLGYGIASIDMQEQLRRAEDSLETAQETRYDPPPPRLERAFTELRAHAGPAHGDLEDAVAAVGEIDLEDETAVADAFDEIEAAAAESSDVIACQQALDVIADYDLDAE